jgi:hypothetical protein
LLTWSRQRERICLLAGSTSNATRLLHHGPVAVLQEIGLLLENHPSVPDLDTKVDSLRKGEQQMQYPLYQQ